MSNRRWFIKRLSAATFGLLLAKKGLSRATKSQFYLPTNESFLNDQESYWRLIQSSFHLEEELVYLNNGTLGPSPAIVEHAVLEKIRAINSNLRYGGGEECRNSLADLMGCDFKEITITHNTTEGLNLAAWGLPLQKGDEVIMTTHEHVGNAMPWLNKRHHDGIKLITFEPAKTHAEILEQINNLITKKTKVITVPHVSCTIGQLFPIKEICQLARDKRIFSVIDGAHGVGALNLDMKDVDADIYVSCGHKWLLGPKGTGMAYVPERMFDVLKPVFAGAYTDAGYDITVNPPTFNGYNKTAHRYDYGTQNTALKYGLLAAADYHLQIGKDKINNRIFELNEYLYSQLIELSEIELLSSSELKSRSMMLGFKHKKVDYKELANQLWKNKFRVRQVPESGINCIRVSTHIYNTHAQIDAFVEALKKVK